MEEMKVMENVVEETTEQVMKAGFDLKSGLIVAAAGTVMIVGGKLVYKHVLKPVAGKVKTKFKKDKLEKCDGVEHDNVVEANFEVNNEEVK